MQCGTHMRTGNNVVVSTFLASCGVWRQEANLLISPYFAIISGFNWNPGEWHELGRGPVLGATGVSLAPIAQPWCMSVLAWFVLTARLPIPLFITLRPAQITRWHSLSWMISSLCKPDLHVSLQTKCTCMTFKTEHNVTHTCIAHLSEKHGKNVQPVVCNIRLLFYAAEGFWSTVVGIAPKRAMRHQTLPCKLYIQAECIIWNQLPHIKSTSFVPSKRGMAICINVILGEWNCTIVLQVSSSSK